MEQKSLLILMFVGVLAIFGGLIFYDIKSNHRLEKSNQKETNWNWNDQWTDQKPNVETKPTEPEVQPEIPVLPQGQIVANSYQDAIKKSGEFGKPVMIMFTADWCGWCTKMKNETLQDARVKAVFENYIIVMINTDQDKASTKKFGVRSLPSYAITNVNEETLKSGTGYKGAEDFLAWLNNPSLYNQPKK